MERRDLRSALLCVLLVLGAIALTVPVAESGVNDDWSYAKTALDLAQTGHLAYNGWSTAMLGAQACWGALFIKVFGFSFLTLRLSTAPLAAGCAVLLYVLHRRSSLPPGLAVFGTLTIILSPLCILSAVTFMTEIPALFLLLTSAYGYVRVAGVLENAGDNAAASASWQNRFRGWLLFALVTGLLSGTVRQTGWIMPVFAPVWLLARRRTFQRLPPARLPLALSAGIAFAAALWLSAWFNNQPYVAQESIASGFPRLLLPQAPLYLCRLTIRILLTLGVFILPLLVTLPDLYRAWSREQPCPGVRTRRVLLLTVLFGLLAWSILDYRRVFPWLDSGTLTIPYLLGTAPIPSGSVPNFLSAQFFKGFSVFIIVLVSGSLALGVVTTMWRPVPSAKTAAPAVSSAPFALFGVFSVVYVLLLLLKGLIPDLFGVSDRYLLPLLPVATLGLLPVFHQRTGRRWPPFPAWFVLAFFAFYGVAQAHDYFAQLRARLAVTGYLEQRGIPRTRILAGLEYDGWTQITVAGHCSDSRIRKPEGSYVPPRPIGFVTMYQWWTDFPAVRSDYVVTLGLHSDLLATDVPAVGYSCWLPPFQRRIMVQVSDPALVSVTSLPVRR
ncbi:MAG: ArnT family glycosyltransferase [Limisphaerales bacterium]